MSDLSTKSAKEEELDLIFAEEFSCDPNFTLQYFREAFPAIGNVKIEDVAIQPKLHDGGYGDLLVLAKANGKSHALLIEHKISAGPAPGQAERYRNHATHLLRSEGRSVVTALVAPRAYVGETKEYDLRLNLEDVIKFMANPEEARLAYRKARVMRAIEKKNASGVQFPDEHVWELHRKYYQTAERFCASSQIPLSFPPLKLEYYDEDAWIAPIGHPDLPNGVELRHRLWTSKVKHEKGKVDLIVLEADENQKSRFESKNSDRYRSSVYGRSKRGVQLSVTLPALKPHAEYSGEVVERACSTMAELVAWYTGD